MADGMVLTPWVNNCLKAPIGILLKFLVQNHLKDGYTSKDSLGEDLFLPNIKERNKVS